MKFFRNLSRFFMVFALGAALYDLVYQGVAEARFKIRTVEEFWTDLSSSSFLAFKNMLQSALSTKAENTLVHLPMPVLLLLISLLFYVIFRVIFLIRGEDKSIRL